MKVLRAAHLGMCFGVRDAIDLALSRAKQEPVTVLGDLVHNPAVLQSLRDQGVTTEHQAANVTTSTVLITAHGASQQTLNNLQQHGHHTVEATCPLVRHAHNAVASLVARGCHPVIIGKATHVEVRGITEDLPACDVILDPADVDELVDRPKFGVVAQTTQPIDRVHHLVDLIKQRFPQRQVEFIDTVCQPTKQRQDAAARIAKQCDVVIVIGGATSNNTHELVNTCSRHNQRVYHVQSAADLRGSWFTETDTVGITAGTSTPDETIEAVETWLKDFASFQEQLAEHVNAHPS